MNIDKVIIVDIESNGLLRESDKIHVVSMAYQKEGGEWTTTSTNDYDAMRKLFSNPNHTIVGHNFICFDIPVIEKVLGIEFKCHVIDTLGLSWALYPWRTRHGLAEYGEEVGIAKPEIEDELWKGLSEEDLALPPEQVKLKWEEHYQIMKHRCEEDCKINVAVWLKFKHKLTSLYSGDTSLIIRYIKYINFKMELLREQEKNMLKVDVKKLEENISLFETMKEEKIEAIMPHMPKVAVTSVKKRPTKPFKKDGSLSKTGENWFNLLNELDLPEDYTGEVKVINKYIDPNPNSHSQVKDWLLGLGWEPKEFKDSTSTDPSRDGEKIPQVRIDGMLCESVLKLKEVSEGIEHLDGLSVLTHRLGALNSIKMNLIDGEYVVARASGLTNTLRFKHASPVVNLSGVTSPNDFEGERDIRDGRYIRELFIPHEGCVFFGSDLSSLEDRFKQHQIRDLDPDFVEEMNVEGFDPHLDLAVLAGTISKEEAELHKKKEVDLSEIRNMYKSGNYACQYGVGKATLSKAIGKSQKEAQKVIDAYWERNWAIKVFAEAQKVVNYEDEMWIINPVNNFRYSLRSDKDRFSTLTQGGSTYVFDLWAKFLMDEQVKIGLNIHDEVGSGSIKKGDEERTRTLCKEKIDLVTKVLKLKRDMDCDTQFSTCYANVH